MPSIPKVVQPNNQQGTVIVLLIFLLVLAIGRSSNVVNFFKAAGQNAGTSISNAAHGNASQNTATAASTLDWHLFLYWGGGALLAVILAGPMPELVIGVLLLIILEEILVHWSVYAKFLSIPTK